jgi:pimeloyl-ACP methyl ester carboxylesterase
VMAMRDASGVSPERKALIASQHDQGILGPLVNFPFLETWDIWQVNDLGDQFRQPVISDVRTLFVSGTLDSSTPPFRAEQVRWGFPNSTYIVIKNAGHDQLMNAPGIQNAMSDFLAGDSVEELKFSLPPLSFVPLKGPAKGDRHPSLR